MYLRPVILRKNNYPLWTIKQLMKEVEESQKQKEVSQISMAEQSNPKELRVHSLLLCLAGLKVQLL